MIVEKQLSNDVNLRMVNFFYEMVLLENEKRKILNMISSLLWLLVHLSLSLFSCSLFLSPRPVVALHLSFLLSFLSSFFDSFDTVDDDIVLIVNQNNF